jgi:hypothetical protein
VSARQLRLPCVPTKSAKQITRVFVAFYESPRLTLRWYWASGRNWLTVQTQRDPFQLTSVGSWTAARDLFESIVRSEERHFEGLCCEDWPACRCAENTRAALTS